MGNLDANRDWGHTKDYVKMQWLMLQQDQPKDYVIATGKQVSVRRFVEKVADILKIEIDWIGSGINEKGKIKNITNSNSNLKIDDIIVEVDPRYYRPTEVENLLGNAEKAKKELGWTPEISLDEMIKEMVCHDLQKATGFYSNEIEPRAFHTLSVKDTKIIRKLGAVKSQIHYYLNIPPSVRFLFPSMTDYAEDFTWYEMQFVQGLPFSQLYVSELMTESHLAMLLQRLDRLHQNFVSFRPR